MAIRHVSIKRFRGIRNLEWNVAKPVACLVGPGDACKSTILDAIEMVLCPNWFIPLDDSDCHGCDCRPGFEITVTCGPVPDDLLAEGKFGLHARGWSPGRGIVDEPEDELEPVLSIRLRVDDGLEPEWSVVNDRHPDGIRISFRDRQKFNVTRIGCDSDRHLSWVRGSALTKLTEDQTQISRIITDANRQARQNADLSQVPQLVRVVTAAKTSARKFGVPTSDKLGTSLDPQMVRSGFSSISLHDDDIPLRRLGSGSRRLVAVGLQLECLQRGATLLLDEVETGLEPHRVRHLVKALKESTESAEGVSGQVIMTTHSPAAIVELGADGMCVVRKANSDCTVTPVPEDLQATVRSVPHAMLSKKLLVCEGDTEYGILKRFASLWCERHEGMSIAFTGTSVVNGGGSRAPARARDLASLGYECCLLADAERGLSPSGACLERLGVTVVQWADRMYLEQRVAMDVPWTSLANLVELAIRSKGQDSVLDSLADELGVNWREVGTRPDDWRSAGKSEGAIRSVIGRKANDGEWFKNITDAERLGDLLKSIASVVPTCDFFAKMKQVEDWIYA